MTALFDALKAVKSDIVTVAPTAPKKKFFAPKQFENNQRPKQFVNGYEVLWASQDNRAKIPFIEHRGDNPFYVQYPTSADHIKLPEGTVRATYNSEKKRVEFFKRGSNEPIRFVADARHEALPLPRYFGEIERVEEIFDIDFETGELTSGMRIDILSEGNHWKLRLQEFEAQQLRQGVKPAAISFRLQKHLKNLESVRGVTVKMLSEPVPASVQDAIDFAIKKQSLANK